MAEISEVVNKLDEMGLIRKSRVTGNWYQCYCPFHNEGKEKKPSFGILLHDEVRDGKLFKAGFGHCFTCSFAGDLNTLVSKILEIHSIKQSGLEWLAEHVPGFDKSQVDFDYLIPPEMSASITNKYAINYIMSKTGNQPKYVSEQELASYRLTVPYMYERKLTDEVIAKYDVGYDANFKPEGSKNPIPCITFPIRDIYGHVLGFCRRSIKGKYFFMDPGVKKSVYGLYELPKGVKTVIITESCFNALTCVAYGRPAVALLGTGTEDMFYQLKTIGASEFVLWLDNDAAGQRGMSKLKRALSKVAIISTAAPIPPLEDPATGKLMARDINNLSIKEFEELYSQKF